MAIVVGAIYMTVTGSPALVACADDFFTDPLAHALIEDKIFPQEFIFQSFGLHLSCIIYDPAIKLVHILKSLMLQVGARLFASDAACAIENYFLIFFILQEIGHRGKGLLESIHIGADGIFEMPH